VLDWRASGGLEALAALKTPDAEMIAALFEARRLLLVEAARLAATRRTDEQALAIDVLATRLAEAPDEQAALLVDWAFMAAVIEASGNLVFGLIMNSVRAIYLPSADAFVRMLGERDLYRRAAEAIAARNADAAAEAIEQLAAEQERRMVRL
jgi:DNA-binding FadR family transcriptional regulator